MKEPSPSQSSHGAARKGKDRNAWRGTNDDVDEAVFGSSASCWVSLCMKRKIVQPESCSHNAGSGSKMFPDSAWQVCALYQQMTGRMHMRKMMRRASLFCCSTCCPDHGPSILLNIALSLGRFLLYVCLCVFISIVCLLLDWANTSWPGRYSRNDLRFRHFWTWKYCALSGVPQSWCFDGCSDSLWSDVLHGSCF